jgi:hypothetical protein
MIILNEDTVALQYIAVYYGIPRYGHKRCFIGRGIDHTRVEQVTRSATDIEIKRCIECGKLVLPKEEEQS